MAVATKLWRPPPQMQTASDPSSRNETRGRCEACETKRHPVSASVPVVQWHPAAPLTHSVLARSKQRGISLSRDTAGAPLLQAALQPFHREASPASFVRECLPAAEHPLGSSRQ